MKALSNESRISVWLFIVAPLISMMMPFILMFIDEESRCHLIPLIRKNQSHPEIYANIYFGLPLAVSLYGVYLIFKNRDLRQTAVRKFYTLCGFVLLDLLSLILLVLWAYVAIFVWIGSGCYELKLMF